MGQIIKLHTLLILTILIGGNAVISSGCGGVGTEPIALPVPFSGTLNGDTNLFAVEGNPVGGASFSQSLSIKNQSLGGGQFPISWNLFDGATGVANGTISLNSRSEPICGPVNPNNPVSGIKCNYDLDACARFGINRVACSSNFECFDFPTDFEPTQEIIDFSGMIPGTIPQVRKLICSGNINSNDLRNQGVVEGELLNAKMIIGSACFPGSADCIFNTQMDSSSDVNGAPFSSLIGPPDGNVVFTLVTQGPALPHPVPEDPLGAVFEVLLPGENGVAGSMFGIELSSSTVPPGVPPDQADAFEFFLQTDFRLNDPQASRLLIRGLRIITNRVPELDESIREVLATDFAGVPGVTQKLIEEGVYIFNSFDRNQTIPINCDPQAGEATGIFQDLCVQFGGSLRATFKCGALAVFSDPPVIDSFIFTGTWFILKD